MASRPGRGAQGAQAASRRGPVAGKRGPQIVHVGAASRDITTDDPRGWRLGGGVSYGALTTAALGVRTVAVIGVDATAATCVELDALRTAGVELLLVPLAAGPIFRNEERPEGRRQLCLDPGQAMDVPALPVSWHGAPVWAVAPVANEVGDAWIEAIPETAFVALGWQGLLRSLTADAAVTRRAPVWSGLLDRADLVALSRHDVEPGTSLATLTALLHPGARLLLTDGRDGGLLATTPGADPAGALFEGRGTSLRYAAVPPDRAVDPTGAGDSFLAALLATIVRPSLVDLAMPPTAANWSGTSEDVVARAWASPAALRFASAVASLVVEGPGLSAILNLAAVRRRLRRAGLRQPAGSSSSE